jgi:hypothetical protein
MWAARPDDPSAASARHEFRRTEVISASNPLRQGDEIPRELAAGLAVVRPDPLVAASFASAERPSAQRATSEVQFASLELIAPQPPTLASRMTDQPGLPELPGSQWGSSHENRIGRESLQSRDVDPWGPPGDRGAPPAELAPMPDQAQPISTTKAASGVTDAVHASPVPKVASAQSERACVAGLKNAKDKSQAVRLCSGSISADGSLSAKMGTADFATFVGDDRSTEVAMGCIFSTVEQLEAADVGK